MSVQTILDEGVKEFNKICDHLDFEYSKLQIGRANPALVDSIMVEVYGASQPLKNMSNISIPDSRTIQIQPWDRSLLNAIEKAIVGIGTGLNPVNDGVCVRINIPPLTEERRKDLTKVVGRLAEEARISIRTARQDSNDAIKQLKASSQITEDDFAVAGKELQNIVDKANEKIEEMSKKKEKTL